MEPPREETLEWVELEAFLASARGATFYHSSTWLRPLEEVYGYRVGFLTLRDAGSLKGLLPFVDRSRRGLVFRESLSFGSYGGPVLAEGAEDETGRILIEALLSSRRGRCARVALFLPPDPEGDPNAPGQLPTHRVDLSPGWESLLAERVRPAKRRQIRQAREAGVTGTRSAEPADMRAYHEIYLESARHWKLSAPTPLEHLLRLQADRERVRLWTARHEGRMIGGMLTFHFGGEVTYWHGTNLREARALRPSALLYATVMETACRAGDSLFNMGASPENPGLVRFKEDFGGRATACSELRREAPWLRILGLLRRRP